MNNINAIKLLKKVCPEEYRTKVIKNNVEFIKFYQRKKHDELRELKIHIENILKNKGDIKIKSGTFCNIEKLEDEYLAILAGKNEFVFFKFYLSANLGESIGAIIINRRKTTYHAPKNWDGRYDSL